MEQVTRILIIAPDFGFGGAEKSVAAVTKVLSQCYEVHLVVFNLQSNPYYETAGSVHSLHVPGGKNIFEKTTGFINRVNRLKKLKKQLNVDVSLSFLEGADYVNILSRFRDKVVINIRGSKIFDPNIRGIQGWVRKNLLIPLLYNRADACTVVSRGLQQELTRQLRIRKTMPNFVIPNFCEPDLIERKKRESLPDYANRLFESPVIITAGRLAYEKGYDLFVPVFSKLKENIPDLKWIIIGEGPFEKILKDHLSDFGLSFSHIHQLHEHASVWFCGFQANPYQWLGRSTLFVLPSRTEGFPNALLEAMACGIPVAAANCPYGPAELLGKPVNESACCEYGMLLPALTNNPETIQIWTFNLMQILENAVLKEHLARQSAARAQQYSYDAVAHLWLNLIETVNEKHSGY